ncbi:MAG: helix-turn-helix domain-containing protein [Candidatus Limnocylindria bacterium]
MSRTRSAPQPVERSGPALKRARRARGLTASQLARAMGVSAQRVYAVETYARCSATLVARYEHALGEAEDARQRRWRQGDESPDRGMQRLPGDVWRRSG